MVRDAGYRRILYKMGYYDYQQELVFRHLDQEGGWDRHLTYCRDFIIRSVRSCQPELLTVLGSGWLLDLPLGDLSALTRKIYLVDIVHPPAIREHAGNLPNIELREEDVTGGLIEEVWNKCGGTSLLRKRINREDITVPWYKADYEQGMVVSLNLLTQLESLPCRFLEKHSMMTAEDLTELKKEIQQRHISYITGRDSVLITDTCEVETGPGDRKKTIQSLLADLPSGNINDEWEWNFDHRRSDYYMKRSVFMVSARCYLNEKGRHQNQI